MVAPYLLSIINGSQSTGCVPVDFKTVVFSLFLKNLALTHQIALSVSLWLLASLKNNHIFKKFYSGFLPASYYLNCTHEGHKWSFNECWCWWLFYNGVRFKCNFRHHWSWSTDLKVRVVGWQIWNCHGVANGSLCHLVITSPLPLIYLVECLRGPLWDWSYFSLYMLPFGHIVQWHYICFHCYADHTQLFLPVKPNNVSNLSRLVNCREDFMDWMSTNFLKLNSDKASSHNWSGSFKCPNPIISWSLF